MAATHAAARGIRGANPNGLPDRYSAMLGVRIQAVLPLILGTIDRRYVFVDQDTESRRLPRATGSSQSRERPRSGSRPGSPVPGGRDQLRPLVTRRISGSWYRPPPPRTGAKLRPK